MRSAMLLSGLTTMVSAMTASCSVAMAGSSASIPGASRARVSARSVSCSSGPSLAVSLSISPPSDEQPIGERRLRTAAVRSSRPPRAADRPAHRAAARAAARRPPRSGGRANRPGAVTRSTTPPGRSSRSIGPSGAIARPSGASSSSSLASRLARASRVVDPQHVGHRVRAAAAVAQRPASPGQGPRSRGSSSPPWRQARCAPGRSREPRCFCRGSYCESMHDAPAKPGRSKQTQRFLADYYQTVGN